MARRRQQRSRNCPSPWRLVLLLLALVAANAQQLVAQTHGHAPVLAQMHAVAAPDPVVPGNLHDDCLLCQIAAHAPAAAPPASMLQFTAPDVFALHVEPVPESTVIPRPAHAWQSRGPPIA